MRPPGIILLDLMMPVMDGWEFAAAIGKDPRFSTVPIVVMTAFSDKAHSVPARSILKKPLSLDEVLDIVGRYCAGSPPAAEGQSDVAPSPARGVK
jgi:CheY-like chemotaxis protein